MDPQKVQAVLDWQAPKTRKQLQSFLGFANFYWQFIPSFARVALPLTELLKTKPSLAKPKSGQPVAWTSECQQAFEQLKTLFTCEPTLKHPDPACPFMVQTDTSDIAVGGILLQKNSLGQLQPCAYTSRRFSATEQRWATWGKEVFTIRWALLTWGIYLREPQHHLRSGQTTKT